MSHPSVSGLERAELCPPSETFPHVQTITSYSDRGTACHRYLARVPVLGRDAALAEVPGSFRKEFSAIEVSDLPACEPDAYAYEVSFGFDITTGKARELGRGLSREEAYARLGPNEIGGTADVVGLVGSDAVYVPDYKRGWAGHVAPAGENFQLHAYALMAARAYGRTRAIVGIIRVKDDGSSWLDKAELDSFSLDATEIRITRVIDRIAEVRSLPPHQRVPVEGSHCRWCPSFHACSAKASLAARIGQGELDEGQLPFLTPENAAKAWQRIKQVRLVLDKAEAAIEVMAERDPIDLGNGMVLAPEETKRRSIKAPIALRVLSEKFGPAIAEAACERETSQAAIKSALQIHRERNPGVKITKLFETTLEDIASAGGLVTKVTHPVREQEASKLQKALPSPEVAAASLPEATTAA